MEKPRRNMFDSFKDQICQDLGPLEPNWFEELTVKAFAKDQGNLEKEQSSTVKSCGQDASFKTPLEKCTLDSSDMFSTPKIFRQRRLQSPVSLTDEEFTLDQEITNTSPCLFGTSIESDATRKPCRTLQYGEHFGLFDTPKQMTHSAKRISESLGAQLDVDVSWTSSLNTPVMSPTIILAKCEDRKDVHSVKSSAEDQVMFVRKLFPSLSKESESTIQPLEINNIPPHQHVGLDGQLTGVTEMSLGSPKTLPCDGSSLWKQSIPDAIEDREIRSTVASVLDGAEDVLSIFFSNSSVALRRVKAKERIKRKQSVSTRLSSIKEHITTDNMEDDKVSCVSAREDQHTSNTSESRTDKNIGELKISQWTPISLSEMSDCDMDAFHHEGTSSMKHIIAHGDINHTFTDSTGNQQLNPGSSKQTVLMESALYTKTVPTSSHPDGSELKRSTVESSLEHTFTRKTFVYCVQNQHLSEKGKYSVSQTLLTSLATTLGGNSQNMKQHGTIADNAVCNTLINAGMGGFNQLVHQECATNTNLVFQAPTNEPDLDMSQLCRAFAQDFSQAVESNEPCSRGGAAIQNGFSTSACVSAVKQTNRKLMSQLESVIGDVRHARNITSIPDASVLRPSLSCKTGSPPSTGMMFISPQSGAKTTKQISVKSIDQGGKVSVPSQPDWGFKTASKRNIHISSANLEKAKNLFKQIENEKVSVDSSDIGLNVEDMSSGMMLVDVSPSRPEVDTHKMTVDNQRLLTVSQRADVSELCSLLEDGDSQFDFTQFISAKPTSYVSAESSDKELDPDLLTGIDFDDSFNSVIEKRSVKMVTSDEFNSIVSQFKGICQVTSSDNTSLPISLTEKPIEHIIHKRALSIDCNSSEKIYKSKDGVLAKKTTRNHLDDMEIHTSEKESDGKHLKQGLCFKTAGGNAMAVSEKCLSKAKALFADLEKIDETNTHTGSLLNTEHVEASPVKSKSEMDSNDKNDSFTSSNKKESHGKGQDGGFSELCDEYPDKMDVNLNHSHKHTNGGFQTASGKGRAITECASKEQKNNCGFSTARGKTVYVSETSLLKARTLLNDCDESENSGPGKIPSLPTQNIKQISYLGFKKPCTKVGSTNVPVTAKNASNRGDTLPDIGGPKSKMLELDNSQIQVNNSSQIGCGFGTASGKRVSVSNEALLKAQALFNDCNVDGEELFKSKKARVDLTIPIQNPLQKLSGFKCVNGMGGTVSSIALHHTVLGFKDCDTIVDVANQEDSAAKSTDVVIINPEESMCGSMTAGGKKVHVLERGILMTRSIPMENLDKKCPYLENGLTKDSRLFDPTKHGSADDPNTDCHTGRIHDSSVKHGQFRTASGKGVVVSTEALQQTKEIFTGCDNNWPYSERGFTNDTSLFDRTKCKSTDIPQMRADFKAASGRDVALSGMALQQVKASLNDCNSNTDSLISAETNQSNSEIESAGSLMNNVGKSYCAFRTAGGKKVCISEKDILRAKSILNDNLDDNFIDTNARAVAGVSDRFTLFPEDGIGIKHGIPDKTKSSDLCCVEKSCDRELQKLKSPVHECEIFKYSQLENCQRVNMDLNKISRFNTANPVRSPCLTTANVVSVLEDSSSSANFKECARFTSPHTRPEEERQLRVLTPTIYNQSEMIKAAGLKHCKVTPSTVKMVDCSSLGEYQVESLGLTDCSVTQKSYFAQEAMDCTKALLEDEDLTDPRPPEQACPVSCKGTSVMRSRIGKRQSEDVQIRDQHPLKRRLLDEFDRTMDFNRRSSFVPAKSSSEGTFKDRRVFKYKTPLQPEVTRPYCKRGLVAPSIIKTECQKTSDPTIKDANPVRSKTAVFVPPFRKNFKPELQRSSVHQDKTQPTVFVPPFRRDNHGTREGFHKASEEKTSPLICESVLDTGTSVPRPQSNHTPVTLETGLSVPRPQSNHTPVTLETGTSVPRPQSNHTPVTLGTGTSVPRPQSNHTPVTLGTGTSVPRPQSNHTPVTLGTGTSVPRPQSNHTPVTLETGTSVPRPQSNHTPVTLETGTSVPRPQSNHTPVTLDTGTSVPRPQSNHTPVTLDTGNSVPRPQSNHTPVTDTSYEMAIESIQEPNSRRTDKPEAGGDGWSRRGVESGTAKESESCEPVPNCTDVEHEDTECLQLARDMQDMRIRKKKRQTIRPLPGSLFLARTSGARTSGVARPTLRNAVRGRLPVQHTITQLYGYGVHQNVAEISPENAEGYRFVFRHHFSTNAFIEGCVQLGDGGRLIPCDDGTAGKYEFFRALCDSPGVDPKLISENWVFNHYRWVVWKMACMERAFPHVMGGACLIPEQVLLQLKYRYDVEVDHSRRSALRKIMERDDTAAKTMVLCVCGVVTKGLIPNCWSETKMPQSAEESSPVAVIWLTDGWYAIKAQLDVPLTAMLHRGRLVVGGKLLVHGAELVGSADACSPLEAPDGLMLKIRANSTRVARWDTRLGFYRDPRPFLLPLSSLYSRGGPVGCVDIVVLRSYPTQWMEKKLDGGFVFRSDRAEEKQRQRHEQAESRAREILFAKIQAQMEKEENGLEKSRSRRTLCGRDMETLLDGEELFEAVNNDPVYLETRLSEQQQKALNKYRQCVGERRQAALQERIRQAVETEGCPERKVSPVWKLSVADSRDQLHKNVYMLNIWNPSQDIQSLLKEGGRYKAYQLSTSEGKKRACNSTIQFTATKKTQFQNIQASADWLCHRFHAREAVGFHSLLNPDLQPLCGEVDLVGYIIWITERQGPSPVVYLVDGQLDFVKVRFFSSLAQQGLEDLVKPLALVALSNLQLCAQHSSPMNSSIPSLYAGDLSTNPRETHLKEATAKLRNLVQEQENFFRIAEEKLSTLGHAPSPAPSPAPPPRTPGLKTDVNPDTRTSITPQQAVQNTVPFSPLIRSSRNTPGSFTGGNNKGPKSLKRKRALDYLSIPPPLYPLVTMTLPSPRINKTFNPPRRAETPRVQKTPHRLAPQAVLQPLEDEWVDDEELAMIDTQSLHDGVEKDA
ncbi:hypothetical protein DPEC_G00241440 [Dallia pectoralis]|uniref:Uncharacterized protein n=1 Tax=Dallia pectoralis TaxID=75939 RepID=A0ACC2FUV5_DALPE|nr:hypothetical protein DPEC_G00241440 [Dallia pectoralis]